MKPLIVALLALACGPALAEETPREIQAHCAQPAGSNDPPPPPATRDVAPQTPDRAKETGRAGCAGIRFKIAADGSVSEAKIVTEYPGAAFKFGPAALKAIKATQYPPSKTPDQSYYTISVFQPAGEDSGHKPSVGD